MYSFDPIHIGTLKKQACYSASLDSECFLCGCSRICLCPVNLCIGLPVKILVSEGCRGDLCENKPGVVLRSDKGGPSLGVLCQSSYPLWDMGIAMGHTLHPMLEPCLPEGLPSMVQTDAGAAGEELKPVGLTLFSSKRRVKGWSNRDKALRTDCTA